MLQRLRPYWDIPFFVELFLLALTAPVLYFPGRFETEELVFTIGILAAGWLWRRLTIGVWFRRTPADWAIFFLFLVMLPVSVWAAPGPLREQYSIPRALILIWNFFLFWTIVSHAGRRRELFNLCVTGFGAVGVGIAVVGVFGTQWSNKFPVIGPLLARLPKPLLGVFAEGGDGINPNLLAGTLLYVLPLLVALAVFGFMRRRQAWFEWLPAGLAAGVIGLVLLLSQSRGALLGMAAGAAAMLLVNRRWGRWTLAALGLAALVFLAIVPLDSLSTNLEAAEDIQAVTGALTLEGRIEIWSRALYGIQDFSFTGMGLGTFGSIVPLLYPLFTIAPDYNFGHAHNFFLQTALDFGIPGAIAVVALYIAGAASLLVAWKKSDIAWYIGLLGTLIAQTVFSMTDAVTMGFKSNFLFWWLFALIFAATCITARQETERRFL